MDYRKITLLAAAALGCLPQTATSGPASAVADLASLPKIAEVDPRFQSYNVEMVEVTGGRFWAPYGGPTGEQYRQRPPEDLADKRLRALTRHLGPAYVRVSGTWANSTYLEAEGENISKPPPGYEQVLTRNQWRGLVDFAHAVDARIGVSYAVTDGARDERGVWKTEQAQRLLDLTREAGGDIAFSEFINEPNAASLGGLPANYSVADYTRDFAIFRSWAKNAAPEMKIVGPGGVGEGGDLSAIPVASLARMLRTELLMKANPNTVDAVSYHFYGDVSQRCASRRPKTAQRSEALTPAWLDLTLRDWRYYSGLRDRYEPGDPMWVTETAQAACGGSPWAARFVDSFRYVNQLGVLAQKNVQVVFHNTLTASDYSLIEESTREPRPNYWAAVLWKRTMGERVLAPPPAPNGDVRLFAHCAAGKPGKVALAVLNIGGQAATVPFGGAGEVWLIEASSQESRTITINGRQPRLEQDGTLSGVDGRRVKKAVNLPAASIAFMVVDVSNRACL